MKEGVGISQIVDADRLLHPERKEVDGCPWSPAEPSWEVPREHKTQEEKSL